MAILELKDVSFEYGRGFRIRDVALNIEEGSFLAVVGPNGSGKSTLIRLMSRALTPSSGQISLLGKPLEDYSPRSLATHLALIPSENHFEFPFPVQEVVAMGRYPHLARLGSLTSQDRDVVEDALKTTETQGFRNRPISELSSGERQLVLIARALAQQTRILILDEPTAHLDLRHQIAIFRLLVQRNQMEGLTVIVILHDLNLVSRFCRRVALLEGGRLTRFGSPAEVLTRENILRGFNADVEIIESESGLRLISYRTESPRGGV